MRTKKTVINSIIAAAMSAVVLLFGFVTQRFFAHTLGLEYLGLNGLFTNIVSMLAVVELGLGSAIVFHMYKPLANDNKGEVKALLNFYKAGYRAIAVVVSVIALLMAPLLPYIVGSLTIEINIYVIYCLFVLDVVLSYLLSYKRSILIADQRSYIPNLIHMIGIVTMNILQIIVLVATKNFYLFLIIKVLMRVGENILINLLANKYYSYIKNIGNANKLAESHKKHIFRNIRALFLHKIGTFIVLGSDNIIISMFLGVVTVGLYSNYYLVIGAITMVVGQMFSSVVAGVGNLLVSSNSQKTFQVYGRIRLINVWLAIVSATGLLLVSAPFIKVWLGDRCLLPFGVVLVLSINLYLQIMRSVTNSFKEAAGIFHPDRYVPLLESIINIVVSIVALQFMGLAGVFVGTVASNLLLHLYSYPKFVYTRLFKRSYLQYYLEFIKFAVIAVISTGLAYVLCLGVHFDNDYYSLMFNSLVSLAVPSFVMYILYKRTDEYFYFLDLFKNIIKKIKIR